MNIPPQIYWAIELARKHSRLDHVPPVYFPNSQLPRWKVRPPCSYFHVTQYQYPLVYVSYVYGNLGADHWAVNIERGTVKLVAIS